MHIDVRTYIFFWLWVLPLTHCESWQHGTEKGKNWYRNDKREYQQWRLYPPLCVPFAESIPQNPCPMKCTTQTTLSHIHDRRHMQGHQLSGKWMRKNAHMGKHTRHQKQEIKTTMMFCKSNLVNGREWRDPIPWSEAEGTSPTDKQGHPCRL